MAKITVVYDTVAKECEVSLDGKKLENVTSFSAYQYMDYEEQELEWSCCVQTRVEDEAEGMSTMQMICASTPEGKAAITAGKDLPSGIEGLIKVEEEKAIHKSIANLYRSKNGTFTKD